MEFVLNSEVVSTDLPEDTRILDYVRSEAGLRGTKEGCREGDCGACTVIVGEPGVNGIRYSTRVSCLMLLGQLEGMHLVTIEGLRLQNLSGIQQAIVDVGATQCGFCTPGIIMALTGFALQFEKGLAFDDALRSLDGNLCRCTGYKSIARAAKAIFTNLQNLQRSGVEALIDARLIPENFREVPGLLSKCAVKDRAAPRLSGGTIIAGGTDIVVQNLEDKNHASLRFLSLESRPEIAEDEEGLRLDATVSFEQFANFPAVRGYIPSIKQITAKVASTPIRNAATLGGNIVNGSPSGDLSILLLTLDASIGVGDATGEKALPLREFFTGYKQNVLGDGEWVKWLRIPKKIQNYLVNFEKVSKRVHLDIATVNTGCSIRLEGEEIEDVLLTAGGVAPIPLFLAQTVDFLKGKTLTTPNIQKAAMVAQGEIAPIDDIRGQASYKTLLLRQLIFAHFYELFQLFPVEQDNVQ